MKNKLGLGAIVLWVVSALVFTFYFFKGATSVSSDQRRAVMLSPQEKDMVLGEMRTMLEAVDGILAALSKNDLKGAAISARSAGMVMAVDVNPILMAKLPLDFKTLGMSTHQAFDDIAVEFDSGMPLEQALSRLNQITNKCVACHQTNRIGLNEDKLGVNSKIFLIGHR